MSERSFLPYIHKTQHTWTGDIARVSVHTSKKCTRNVHLHVCDWLTQHLAAWCSAAVWPFFCRTRISPVFFCPVLQLLLLFCKGLLKPIDLADYYPPLCSLIATFKVFLTFSSGLIHIIIYFMPFSYYFILTQSFKKCPLIYKVVETEI